MKYFFFNPFALIFLFAFTSISYSQERTVTGFVTTLEKISLANAEVKVLSSKVTVLTDSVGYFKVNCLFSDKIKISAKGFYSQKIEIHKKTKEAFINLIFKPGEKNLNVALGYGHVKEKDKTYAISTIRNNDKSAISTSSNMLEVIANSSTSIILRNGQIIIRGLSSLNGSSGALILLDGSQVSSAQLSSLSPFDVKNIDILKGGAAAIYGSRGANGVVLVTTKGGRDGD